MAGYYSTRMAHAGGALICFLPEFARRGDDDIIPYDFRGTSYFEIAQQRNGIVHTDWVLPVSFVTSLIGQDSVYNNDLRLALDTYNNPLLLAGTEDDFRALAEQLKRAFPNLSQFYMHVLVHPTLPDLGPFFRALKARALHVKLAGPETLVGEQCISLLESTVLNQFTSRFAMRTQLSSLQFSRLQLVGERNTALLELHLEFLLKRNDAPGAGDWLAKWLFRFQNLKHVKIMGDFDVAFFKPFLVALQDGKKQSTNDAGLAADCMVIEFPFVYVAGDGNPNQFTRPDRNPARLIPQECQQLVVDIVKEWEGGFIWIALGRTFCAFADSEFRKKLLFEAARKWIMDAPHLGETTIRRRDLEPDKIKVEDVYTILQRTYHEFPPVNFRELFPGIVPNVDFPFNGKYLSNPDFRCKIAFDLLRTNPNVLELATKVVPIEPRPHESSRTE